MPETLTTTQQILDHHLAAFLAGDLDELMLDYSESSVFITPETTLTGPAAIRAFFAGVFQAFSGITLELIRQEIAGDVAYIFWKGEADTASLPMATDTFVIREGKIVAQTIASQIVPK